MTLEEAKQRGIIPSLEDNELIDICKSMGMNVVDIKSQIDVNKFLNRLQYSSVYHKINARNEMQSLHNNVIQRYDELINNYQDILNNMPADNSFDEERNSITAIINTIKSEKGTYQTEIGNFNYKNINQYFNYNNNSKILDSYSSISSSRTHNLETKSASVSTELNSLYRNEDRLEQRQARTRSTAGRISNKIKIQRIQRRINRLRKKQGRINSNQRTIIANNTELYVSRMDRRFDLYAKEFNRINDSIEEKKAAINEINEITNSINEKNSLAGILNTERVSQGRIGRFMTDKEIKRNQKEINKLQQRQIDLNSKYGNINVMQQYNEIINRKHYAR